MRYILSIVLCLLICSGLTGCDMDKRIVVKPELQYESTIERSTEDDQFFNIHLSDEALNTDAYLFYLHHRNDWSDSGIEYLRDIPVLTSIRKSDGVLKTVEMPSMSLCEWDVHPNGKQIILWGSDGEQAIVQMLNFSLEVENTVTLPMREDIVTVCVTETSIFMITLSNIYHLSINGTFINQLPLDAQWIAGAAASDKTVLLGYGQSDGTSVLQAIDFSHEPSIVKEHTGIAPTTISALDDRAWRMYCFSDQNEPSIYYMTADDFEISKHMEYTRVVKRKRKTIEILKFIENDRLLLITRDDANSISVQFTVYDQGNIASSFEMLLSEDGVFEQIVLEGDKLRFIYKEETEENVHLSEYLCDIPLL